MLNSLVNKFSKFFITYYYLITPRHKHLYIYCIKGTVIVSTHKIKGKEGLSELARAPPIPEFNLKNLLRQPLYHCVGLNRQKGFWGFGDYIEKYAK